jgi:O-antigen ligase
MKPSSKAAAAVTESLPARIFAALFGAFLGLSLLKFGNPPIMEVYVTAPNDLYEFLLSTPWPIAWAYWLLGALSILGILMARWKLDIPWWLIALPLAWLVWQCVATAHSVDPALSKATLKHFAACTVCFFLGFFALGRAAQRLPFWAGLLCGFLLVLAVGWDQHLGSLKETRDYFFLYVYKQGGTFPPEYIKKLRSERIFSTLFYPNALAGVLLLLLPAILVTISSLPQQLASKNVRLLGFGMGALASICFYRFGSKGAALLALCFALVILLPAWKICLAGLVAAAALACLYWSGSKAGWLLMLLLSLIALLRLPMDKRFKIALLSAVLLLGLTGFLWKYSGFFQKGATSVSARFDYWRAALETAKANPIFGTGPGTFAIPYAKIKRPESEMARLVHSDYLEQASDSGILGFLAYTGLILAGLVCTFPKSKRQTQSKTGVSPVFVFSVWVGVFGWALQSLLEFGLYIPALAWPAFALLGWLLGTKLNPIDKAHLPA